MTSLAGFTESTVITVDAWRDPVVDALGHDARSLYVETFWLPVLGPSTTLLLRRVAACLEASPSGCALDVVETSRALGLGERSGRNAPFLRTVARCVDFEMARVVAPGALSVRTVIPPLARRHLARLPQALRDEHALLDSVSGGAATVPIEEMRRRGRQLALSLVELGEDEPGAARQLIRWRFHPALALECAAWAADARGTRSSGPAALPARPERMPLGSVGSVRPAVPTGT
ncbi:MAG TPA: hypothetical protein VND23_06120 [Acidimicrobiales bacterium]|nr:hypothetical protein [Acidimicrobiales bacterium]